MTHRSRQQQRLQQRAAQHHHRLGQNQPKNYNSLPRAHTLFYIRLFDTRRRFIVCLLIALISRSDTVRHRTDSTAYSLHSCLSVQMSAEDGRNFVRAVTCCCTTAGKTCFHACGDIVGFCGTCNKCGDGIVASCRCIGNCLGQMAPCLCRCACDILCSVRQLIVVCGRLS